MTPISVTVTLVAPGIQEAVPVTVDARSTVADAVAASGLVDTYRLDRATLGFGRFGRRVEPTSPLHDGDRIDLTRPITADPKEARRRRAAHRQAGRPA